MELTRHQNRSRAAPPLSSAILRDPPRVGEQGVHGDFVVHTGALVARRVRELEAGGKPPDHQPLR
jgi:hypothetical protein